MSSWILQTKCIEDVYVFLLFCFKFKWHSVVKTFKVFAEIFTENAKLFSIDYFIYVWLHVSKRYQFTDTKSIQNVIFINHQDNQRVPLLATYLSLEVNLNLNLSLNLNLILSLNTDELAYGNAHWYPQWRLPHSCIIRPCVNKGWLLMYIPKDRKHRSYHSWKVVFRYDWNSPNFMKSTGFHIKSGRFHEINGL